MSAPFVFKLPPQLAASAPPESRGLARDEVRLLYIDRHSGRLEHTRFNCIGEYLRPGDLLVFNSSRTLPASLVGCETPPPQGPCIEVRLAEHLPDDTWLALLLCRDAGPSSCGLSAGLELGFEGGLTCRILAPAPDIARLWRIRFSLTGTALVDALRRIGQPIRYGHLSAAWNLDYFQTVYARDPGSMEMPSAGRAFTWRVLFDLKHSRVEMAYIVLHTSLSSYMDDALDALHPLSEEEYVITQDAADAINRIRSAQGRVIAVGTTVVRALESVASDGRVTPGHGYTRLHIAAGHRLSVADGLLTGLHDPAASHLDLLAAFVPPQHLHAAYEEAIRLGYLWHEFGDPNLIL